MSFLRTRFATHRLSRSLVSALALTVAAACSRDADAARRDGADSTPMLPASAIAVTPADTDDFGVPLPTDAQFASRVV